MQFGMAAVRHLEHIVETTENGQARIKRMLRENADERLIFALLYILM